jgi:hypothetical protein
MATDSLPTRPLAYLKNLARLARLEARDLSAFDAMLEGMTDAELEAEVLRHRPVWAQEFATRGDPREWSEWRTTANDVQQITLDEWIRWHDSPATYLTDLEFHGRARR